MDGHMLNPLVSVIIPCYRQGRFLGTAIESVLRQTYPAVEIIVVNDGSDDNTREVAEGFGSRIRYVEQANGGLSSARNAGFQVARGEWTQFLDADDLIDPEKIESQVAAARADSSVDIVYSEFRFSDAGLESMRDAKCVTDISSDPFRLLAEKWERGLSIPIHCLLVKRTCLASSGGFDTNLPTHEDWDWHLRCALQRTKYLFVPGKTAVYRIHGENMSRDAARMRRGKLLCLQKLVVSRSLSREQRIFAREVYIFERLSEIAKQNRQGTSLARMRALMPPVRGSMLFQRLLWRAEMTILYRLLCATLSTGSSAKKHGTVGGTGTPTRHV